MKKLGQFSLTHLPNLAQAITVPLLVLALNILPNAHAASLTELFSGQPNANETGMKKDKPLPVHEAFAVFAEQKGDQLTLRFEVKDGYYLYQNKIKLELADGVIATPLQFSLTPATVNDPDFGPVPVFDKNFTATTILSSKKPLTHADALVKWQGCAKAGLCYPPEKTPFALARFTPLPPVTKFAPATVAPTTKIAPNVSSVPNVSVATAITDRKTQQAKAPQASQNDKVTTATPAKSNPLASDSATAPTPVVARPSQNPMANAVAGSEVTGLPVPLAAPPVVPLSVSAVTSGTDATVPASASTVETSEKSEISTTPTITTSNLDLTSQNNDPFGLITHPLWAMGLLFLAGLGLAFTPCVLPMLPIVANIIARQHQPTAKKGLLLTLGYGVGVATSYGLLGAIIGLFGQSLGILNWLQNPVILLSFAVLFVLLGLYMLDRLPIRLPAKLSHQLNKLTQVGENRLGSVTGSFITGFFSALVVSPCVSAPLAGALAGVATTGSPVIGFFALFMLGLGLSTPLILLGATQGNFMPTSGAWMNSVKTGFALLMFAVALLMVERVFITSWMLGLWAVWFAVVAVWLWSLQGVNRATPHLLTQALSLLFGVWSACLLVGMASGATDSWQPLKPLLTAKNVTNNPGNHNGNNSANALAETPRITTLAQLQPMIANKQKILVDVTADWCIECRIMDKNLFANPPAKLAGWQVVKLDVTADTPASRAVYEQLKVFGPPVLLYFDQGKLVFRQNGEVKREEFERALGKL